MAKLSESQRIRRAIQGDRGALGDLLRDLQPRLYNVTLRMVGNPDDASELTQETMLRIIQHIGSFDGQSAFSTWAIRIAMNLSISHLRKRKVRLAASLDAVPHGSSQLGQATALHQALEDQREPQPDERVQQQEMIDQLTTALGQVDTSLRAILILRDLQEMDYSQIAQVLALPLGTVKSRLFRARLALRRQMYKLSSVKEPPRDSTRLTTTDATDPKPSGSGRLATGRPMQANKDNRPEFPAG